MWEEGPVVVVLVIFRLLEMDICAENGKRRWIRGLMEVVSE